MVTHRGRRTKATLGATSSMSSTPVIDLNMDHERNWASFMNAVISNFDAAVQDGGFQLFTTDAPGLWNHYLRYLPSETSVHDCRTCRRFIENFGGLVTIADSGQVKSALWNPSTVPEFYQHSVQLMHDVVLNTNRTSVTGVFVHAHDTLGIEFDGTWTHLHARLPRKMIHTHPLKEPHQVVADKAKDFETLDRAMVEFGTVALEQACKVLEADAVTNAEKFVAPTRFLLDLRRRLNAQKHPRLQENILWKAVAGAPIGWCSPRSGMIGSLLEDIEAGKSFQTVQRNFNKKVGPLDYQRPKAAPKAGTIQTAERIFEKLDLARSIERRFARLDEVGITWLPVERKRKSRRDISGVFDHLMPKGDSPPKPGVRVPHPMTWVKFAATVLPAALKIEQNVPLHGRFIALTAPVHADAKPLFKWDDGTNPIAWYVIPTGALASRWNLQSDWTQVTGVARLPSSRLTPDISDGVVLVLDKAVDTENAGLALYPVCLRAELHEVRSVIEAHSKTGRLAGREQASACGYDVRRTPEPINVHLRVLNDLGWTEYKIDRFD